MVIIIEIINIILYTLPILHPYLLHNMDKIFPSFGDYSISDSLRNVAFSVLIYEAIIQ